MSMFHELMMRKKEQIMYATIKGSLTENDGVFSGFSGTNYLALQNQFTLSQTTKAEIIVKITPTNTSIGDNAIFGSISKYGIAVLLNANGNLQLFIGNYSSWQITKQSAISLSVNTDYWIKLVIVNNTATLYYSSDGANYNLAISSFSMGLSSENNYTLAFGRGRTTSAYFRGAIDLPNSYIKLGSTKYNLQAVVGYTVVGSPTITDGVVSGFSSGDYLTLGARTLNLENIVFHTKFKTGTLQSNETYTIFMFGNYGSAYPIGFLIQNKRFRLFYAGNANSGNVNTATTYFLDDNTEYEVEFGTKNSKRYCKFGLAGNMTDFTLNGGSDTDFVGSMEKWIWLGVVGTNYNWAFTDGSIDLNSTYIKNNNKLWFNGQQA